VEVLQKWYQLIISNYATGRFPPCNSIPIFCLYRLLMVYPHNTMPLYVHCIILEKSSVVSIDEVILCVLERAPLVSIMTSLRMPFIVPPTWPIQAISCILICFLLLSEARVFNSCLTITNVASCVVLMATHAKYCL
jgi:hypothetical protein